MNPVQSHRWNHGARWHCFVAVLMGALSWHAPATTAAEPAPGASMGTAPDRWYVDCYGRRCSMSHILQGEGFEITLGLHFERRTGKLAAVAAKAPADADHDRGIEISFGNTSAPQTNTVAITVPLAPCDDTGCMGSVESGRDLQSDFIDNIHKHQMLTVSYHVRGQRMAIVEDTGHFRSEYPDLLAKMKKPQ